MSKARAMTYDSKDVEDFDEAASEDLFVNGGGLPDDEPAAEGVIVDEDTGEILLPGEEPMEAEIVPEPAAEEPAAPKPEPPLPKGSQPLTNDQANAVKTLAKKTWTGENALTHFKQWLGQKYGVTGLRELTGDQAKDAIKVLTHNLEAAANAERKVA
jgi:hypothetical protein